MKNDGYINEIFSENCKDYAGGKHEGLKVREKLWAIEQTMKGIDLANKDLHKFIDFLRGKFYISDDEFNDLVEESYKKELGK